jgi:hypothetical protein
MRARPAARLLVVAGVLASCHLIFPFGQVGTDAGDAGDGSAPEGPALDHAALEGGGVDTGPVDLLPAGDGVIYTLDCGSPSKVNDMKDGSGNLLSLVEPAMQLDEKTLVAREQDGALMYRATRLSGASFGPWEPWDAWNTSQQLKGHEDPSFVVRAASPQVLTAWNDGSGVRVIQACALTGSGPCQDVGILVQGQPLTGDLDGPDLRQIELPGVEDLVFARAETAGGLTDLYLATGAALSGPFTAEKLPLSTPEHSEDDPAISPDGALMVYTSNEKSLLWPVVGGQLDLWLAGVSGSSGYSRLAEPWQSAFSAMVNKARDDAAPDLAYYTLDGGMTLELFFHSDRGQMGGPGPFAIYRAACGVMPQGRPPG